MTLLNYYLNAERIESILNQIGENDIEEIIVKNGAGSGGKRSSSFSSSLKFLAFGGIDSSVGKEENWLKNREFSIRIVIGLEKKLDIIKQKLKFEDFATVSKTRLDSGQAVIIEHTFFSKNLKSPGFYKSDKWDGSLPYLYMKVKNGPLKVVKIPYSPEHLVTMSSWVHLSGHKRLRVYGIVASKKKDTAIIAPLSIGSPESPPMMLQLTKS